MATFKAYPNGSTMGVGNAAPVGGKRGEVVGWSAASVRRHKRWLYGVEAPQLSGQGDAVTLTMRDTPGTVEEWQRLLRLLFDGLRDRGMIRWHWVVEWQRRGTPHLHLAVYGPENEDLSVARSSVGDASNPRGARLGPPLPPRRIPPGVLPASGRSPGVEVVALWLRLTEGYGSGRCAQYITPITGPVGWLKYLSKHASRGVKHYQRQGKPAGWEKTGRLWGYGGEWPVSPPVEGMLTGEQYHRVRRMVRSWAVADARARGDFRGVAYLRRMLKCPDRMLSTVRGVSEWVPGPMLVSMAVCAGWQGELPGD
jgi:hypothetical protein